MPRMARLEPGRALCNGPAGRNAQAKQETAPVIELEGATYRYSGADALRDVTLTMAQGAMAFLTGPSGAGKSTLMKLLYLSLTPTSGTVRLFGRDAATLNRREIAHMRRRIGVVFQDFRLLDHLSVVENIALPLRIAGARPADYADDVAELAEWVGLGDRLDARPPELSGGEQQRIAIARAVVASPDIILADEPTGNVDPDMGARLMGLLLELNKLGKTVLVATHDLALAARLDAPVLRLEGGRLAEAAEHAA